MAEVSIGAFTTHLYLQLVPISLENSDTFSKVIKTSIRIQIKIKIINSFLDHAISI